MDLPSEKRQSQGNIGVFFVFSRRTSLHASSSRTFWRSPSRSQTAEQCTNTMQMDRLHLSCWSIIGLQIQLLPVLVCLLVEPVENDYGKHAFSRQRTLCKSKAKFHRIILICQELSHTKPIRDGIKTQLSGWIRKLHKAKELVFFFFCKPFPMPSNKTTQRHPIAWLK